MKKVIVIAKRINELGGKAYFVGGYVRDKLLGIDNKDIDIEVHGIEVNELKELLKEFGTVLEYGNSFGIFSLKGENIDIALPRKETKIGEKHTDFKIDVDPYIGTYKAALRRDFTINALYQDILTNEIIDHFNGLNDLKNKVIKHVNDDTFKEDPLRVLRCAQFASRFEFDVDSKTIELCKQIDLSTLSKERVFEELNKALLKAHKPSIFFETLNKMNQLDYWFKEIKELQITNQDTIHHPEGNAYIHTMLVLDESSKYLDKVSDILKFRYLCLTHDLGKIKTSFEKDGRIHSYGHENELEDCKNLIRRLTNEKELMSYLKNMIPLHMKPRVVYKDKSHEKATNKLFDEAIEKIDLIYFPLCDKRKYDEDYLNFMMDRLKIFDELMTKPYVSGDDLLKAGIKEGTSFKEALNYAHKLRLAGVNKDSALKQTLSYIKNELDN